MTPRHLDAVNDSGNNFLHDGTPTIETRIIVDWRLMIRPLEALLLIVGLVALLNAGPAHASTFADLIETAAGVSPALDRPLPPFS